VDINVIRCRQGTRIFVLSLPLRIHQQQARSDIKTLHACSIFVTNGPLVSGIAHQRQQPDDATRLASQPFPEPGGCGRATFTRTALLRPNSLLSAPKSRFSPKNREYSNPHTHKLFLRLRLRLLDQVLEQVSTSNQWDVTFRLMFLEKFSFPKIPRGVAGHPFELFGESCRVRVAKSFGNF